MVVHRLRRILPLIAVTAGLGGANLIANGAPLALASCSEAASLGSSCSGSTSGTGSVTLGNINSGDATQVTVSGAPGTPLYIERNFFDDSLTCQDYTPLSGDSYYFAQTDVLNGVPISNTSRLELKYTVATGNKWAPLAVLLGRAQLCYGETQPFHTRLFTPPVRQEVRPNPVTGQPETIYVGQLANCSLLFPHDPCIEARTANFDGVVNIFVDVPAGSGDPRTGH